MAQFDLYELDGTLVVDLQSDLIGLDLTRIVAPLHRDGLREFLPCLTPEVEVAGKKYVAHVHDLATISRSDLGERIGSLRDYGDELLRAIDILTRGF